MPVKAGTVKIFLGNLSDDTGVSDVRPLFEDFGKVVETDVLKNFGFVHMEDEAEAKRAITALNGKNVRGKPMSVEMSTGLNKRGMARKGRCKIFVGNVHKDTTVEELRALFEPHGAVVEADIITNFAFVHMETEREAQLAVDQLAGTSMQLHGQQLRVQMSTSSVRQVPGMDKSDMCYRCGSRGHWSKDCGAMPVERGYPGPGGQSRDRGRYAPYPSYGPPAPPPPPHHAYRRDPYYDAVPPPRRDPYYDAYPAPAPVAYRREYDRYGDYDLYERRAGAVAAPLPPMHDPYGPPPSRRAPMPPAEPLYERRAPIATAVGYRQAPMAAPPRRMY